jgi:hypothetical protein
MPNEGAMAQLSRPYQIGLAAVAVLAAAWLLLIQGHHETSTSSSSSAPSPAHVSSTPAHTTAPAKKAEGNAGEATGGGSASSLGALGHAVEKARGAVATSKADEHKLAERSAQASSPTSSAASETKATTPSTAAPSTAAAKTKTKTAAPTHAAAKPKAPAATHHSTTNVRQHTVEAQLAQGKIAVILFWDSKGSDDRSVHGALRSLRGDKALKVAIDVAPAGQVASFGSITRGVQVFGTPTIVIVNKKGRAMILTGLQDSYAIAQAVREVRASS